MIDIKLLANISKINKFPAGTVLVSEIEREQDEMYILLIGNVKAIKNYKKDNEIILGNISPGNIFGEINLFANKISNLTIVAQEEVTVAAISRKSFKNIVKQNYEAVMQIMEMLCERVANSTEEIARCNVEKTTLFKDYNINPEEFYNSLIYPKGHATYNVIRPKEFENVLYNETFTCPYCNSTFEGKIPLTSKLVLKGDLSCNMRRIYHDFDPIWYEIVTCPNCYFSAPESYFTSDEKLRVKEFEDRLGLIKSRISLDFNEPRTLNQVFASNYLALACSGAYDRKKQIDAKIWLSLSWLYEDIKDRKMELFAAQKAYYYTKIYYSECELSTEAAQVALMIMGTLARKLKNYDEAIYHLSNAVRVNPTKTVYKRLIENEIYYIREERDK